MGTDVVRGVWVHNDDHVATNGYVRARTEGTRDEVWVQRAAMCVTWMSYVHNEGLGAVYLPTHDRTQSHRTFAHKRHMKHE